MFCLGFEFKRFRFTAHLTRTAIFVFRGADSVYSREISRKVTTISRVTYHEALKGILLFIASFIKIKRLNLKLPVSYSRTRTPTAVLRIVRGWMLPLARRGKQGRHTTIGQGNSL
jgi:hypothetical protein